MDTAVPPGYRCNHPLWDWPKKKAPMAPEVGGSIGFTTGRVPVPVSNVETKASSISLSRRIDRHFVSPMPLRDPAETVGRHSYRGFHVVVSLPLSRCEHPPPPLSSRTTWRRSTRCSSRRHSSRALAKRKMRGCGCRSNCRPFPTTADRPAAGMSRHQSNGMHSTDCDCRLPRHVGSRRYDGTHQLLPHRRTCWRVPTGSCISGSYQASMLNDCFHGAFQRGSPMTI